MSKQLKVEMSASFVFDPDYPESDPAKAHFYEVIRLEVDRIMDEFGVKTGDDVDNLPLDKWSELRQRLLGLKISLGPNGEIIYE